MPVVKRPKPKAIVFDVPGVIAKYAFMSNSEESKTFIRTYIKQYVEDCFLQKDFRLSINYLRKPSILSTEQPATGSVPPPPIADQNASYEQQVDSIVANVIWRLDSEGVTGPVAYFHMNMSHWGYNKGLLKTAVYDDVPSTLKKWKEVDKINLYVTLGNASFLKKVFTQTTAGDLITYIEAHMNLMISGNKNDYNILSPMLKEQPNNILLISRDKQECRNAKEANIPAVIILRPDYDPKAVERYKKMDKTKTKAKTKKASTVKNKVSGQQKSEKQVKSNIELVPSVVDDPSSPEITEKDLRDFPVIEKLNDLVWTK